jgi:uroporphyrinogen decarboxylase
MGTTELMMAVMTNPAEVHQLLRKITDYLAGFHQYQQQQFPSVDGILLLDDIIGFISEDQFKEFGLPYFKELFNQKVSIKFLHNDANCMESIRYLPELGVNLFNMGFETDLNQLKELTGNRVTMLGNIPPRDVLARGTEAEVREATSALLRDLKDPSRVIFSCGGGMPPGVSTKNIQAFTEAVQDQKV